MVRIDIEGVPPSSNHAYFNHPRGGRSLTKEGKSYKIKVTTHIAQKYPQALRYFKPNLAYTILVQFTFLPTDFYNKTHGKEKGAESLYKRIDVTNRVKLLEDAFKDATAVDDSCTMLFITRKVAGDTPRTTLLAWCTEIEPDPFTLLIDSVIGAP